MASTEVNPGTTDAPNVEEVEVDEAGRPRAGRLLPVTRARIIAVAEQLEREGLPASTNRIRERLGKHSFSTIQMVLEEWKSSRATKVTESEVMPPEVPGASPDNQAPMEERGSTTSLAMVRALDQRFDQRCLVLEQRIDADRKAQQDGTHRAIATAESVRQEVLTEIRSLREDHRSLRTEQQREDRSRIEDLLRSTHRAQLALIMVSGVMLVLLGAVVWLISHRSITVPNPTSGAMDVTGGAPPTVPSESHAPVSPSVSPTPTTTPSTTPTSTTTPTSPAPPPASTHSDKPEGPSGKDSPGPSTDSKGGAESSVNGTPPDPAGKPEK